MYRRIVAAILLGRQQVGMVHSSGVLRGGGHAWKEEYRMPVTAILLVGVWSRLKSGLHRDITREPHEMGLVRSGMDRGVRGTAHSGFSITSSDSFSKDNRFLFLFG